MQSEYFLQNGQSQSVSARAVARLIAAVEHLEQARQLGFRNGFAVVLDGQQMIAAVRQPNGHAPVFRRILGGILEQAADGTPQQVFAQEKLLRSVGLDVPQTEQLLLALRARGVNIPTDALTPGQCARLLRQYIPAV